MVPRQQQERLWCACYVIIGKQLVSGRQGQGREGGGEGGREGLELLAVDDGGDLDHAL